MEAGRTRRTIDRSSRTDRRVDPHQCVVRSISFGRVAASDTGHVRLGGPIDRHPNGECCRGQKSPLDWMDAGWVHNWGPAAAAPRAASRIAAVVGRRPMIGRRTRRPTATPHLPRSFTVRPWAPLFSPASCWCSHLQIIRLLSPKRTAPSLQRFVLCRSSPSRLPAATIGPRPAAQTASDRGADADSWVWLRPVGGATARGPAPYPSGDACMDDGQRVYYPLREQYGWCGSGSGERKSSAQSDNDPRGRATGYTYVYASGWGPGPIRNCHFGASIQAPTG
jgi:hypothetical protein